jgi:hypothetical protein
MDPSGGRGFSPLIGVIRLTLRIKDSCLGLQNNSTGWARIKKMVVSGSESVSVSVLLGVGVGVFCVGVGVGVWGMSELGCKNSFWSCGAQECDGSRGCVAAECCIDVCLLVVGFSVGAG